MTARQEGLRRLLAGWSPEKHAEIRRMVARLAADLLSNESRQHVVDERPGEVVNGRSP
jgi:hypothetical protein